MNPLPTKEEIRRKYGISENDFQTLKQNDLPTSESLLKEQAFIVKKGFWGGFEVWLKRAVVGQTILAVIFIGSFVTAIETIHKYGNIIYTNWPQIVSYAEHFPRYAKDSAKGFLVHTEMPPTEEDRQHQDWAIFPTGSQIYPVTGSWTPS